MTTARSPAAAPRSKPTTATTATVTAAVAVGVTMLAGCAGAPYGGDPGGDPGAGGDATYTCMGREFALADLTNAPTANQAGEHGQAALQGQEVTTPADLAEWVILAETDTEFVIIRELPTPEDLGAGDLRTHELIQIDWVDAPNLDPSPTWHLATHTSCSPTIDLGGLAEAFVTLDSANLPDRASATLHLLVTELACNSGEPATGRVELVSLEEGNGAVAVAVAVRPRTGGADCPSNPPTPFTVELDAPLGDREIVNAAVYPNRPIVLP